MGSSGPGCFSVYLIGLIYCWAVGGQRTNQIYPDEKPGIQPRQYHILSVER